jgi:putative ABC transport system permease protein
MSLLRSIASGLRLLFRKKQVDHELEEELNGFLEMAAEEKMKEGMSRKDALRAVRLDRGTLEVTKQIVRSAGWESLVETCWEDLRFAARMLRKNPGFTAVAVLTLALGIGANTAIFSLLDTVMFRMLPVQEPQELLQVGVQDMQSPSGEPDSWFSNAVWEALRNRQDVFSGIFSWSRDRFDLAQGGAVHYVDGLFVSGDYFNTLAILPAAGRLLATADDQRGCPGAAVLSYGFWRDHFGGAQTAIGSTISLNNHPFEVVGVSSPGFYGVDVGNKFDVAIPVCTSTIFDEKNSRLDNRDSSWLHIIGRVKPGVTPDQRKARLGVLSPQVFAAAVSRDWSEREQQFFLRLSLVTSPGGTGISYLRSRFEQPLHILMAVAGLVLLIACANIASLMLARAAARNREIAVRKALGASRGRLVRQFLTECMLLSSAGALLGLLFARGGTGLLVRYLSTGKTKVFLVFSLDRRVLGFTVAITLLTGILFGILPAFRSARVSLTSAMKSSQTFDSERRIRFRPARWIVAAQVALSLVLLVASGLFLRSFVKLSTLNVGFDRKNVLIVHADLHTAKVPPEQWLMDFDQIGARLLSLPGVASLGRSVFTPISGTAWVQTIHTDWSRDLRGNAAQAWFNYVSPGYFETLRMPVLVGRDFNDRDTNTAPMVAIVNETLARKFFPNRNPVGKTLRIDAPPTKQSPPIEVVGVIEDSKYGSLREGPLAKAFFPISHVPRHGDSEDFVIRTATPPMSLASAVQDTVAGVDKSIPLEFSTLAEQVDDSLVQERLLASLSTFFGALALLLAMIGLYGAMSYLVAQRQTEFGVRMAIGAPQKSIFGLVMRDVVIVLAGGLAAGACLAFATVGVLHKLLFGLAPHDSFTFIAAIGILSGVASVAGYIPARRATRVDPMVALRHE